MKPNIERLQKLVDFLKGLNRYQFRYSDYVSDCNDERTCGTVCCAAGWMPEAFKEESPFTWEDMIESHYLVRVASLDGESIKELFNEKEQAIAKSDITLHALDVKLMAFFELTYEEKTALFQGSFYNQVLLGLPETNLESNLYEVIHLFESFIKKYSTDDQT